MPHIQILGLGAEWQADEWSRYGIVRVQIEGVTYEVGAVLGVPEHLRGTAEAAGGDPIFPYLSAWYASASDWDLAPRSDGGEGVPEELADAVLHALDDAAAALWSRMGGEEVPAPRRDYPPPALAVTDAWDGKRFILGVEDRAGGIWWPDDAAQDEIQTAPDPRACILRLVVEEPLRGRWHQ